MASNEIQSETPDPFEQLASSLDLKREYEKFGREHGTTRLQEIEVVNALYSTDERMYPEPQFFCAALNHLNLDQRIESHIPALEAMADNEDEALLVRLRSAQLRWISY